MSGCVPGSRSTGTRDEGSPRTRAGLAEASILEFDRIPNCRAVQKRENDNGPALLDPPSVTEACRFALTPNPLPEGDGKPRARRDLAGRPIMVTWDAA